MRVAVRSLLLVVMLSLAGSSGAAETSKMNSVLDMPEFIPRLGDFQAVYSRCRQCHAC